LATKLHFFFDIYKLFCIFAPEFLKLSIASSKIMVFMKHRLSSLNIGSMFVVIALLIVVASGIYTNRLVEHLKVEEQQRVHIWADATRRLIQADETEDLSFYLSIIEANTNIPVYIVDAEGKVLESRNVKRQVEDPRVLNGPIELRLTDDLVQYIYYDESITLTQLKWLPYIELGIIFLFAILAIITLFSSQRSEQDRVWVGMSKETAHQLGTPISSLNAWQELLQTRYPKDELIPQMRLDIQRLSTIAERFSKVGSEPQLMPTNLMEVVDQTVAYIRTRISNKVLIDVVPNGMNGVNVFMNAPLFSWVIENLMRNAIDAMNGVGHITLEVHRDNGYVYLDITDTGRGIERGLYRTIFQPGYTSKQRGWGLGLSLSKRIIEEYHSGKIFVLRSEVNMGTTFRIALKETIYSGTTARHSGVVGTHIQ